MSYDYELPKITPVAHEDLIASIGHAGLRQFIKTAQPSPEEVEQMLELAEELPLN